LSGSKHIEFLLDRKLITTQPSRILDELYASGKNPFDTASVSSTSTTSSNNSKASEETMILRKSNGKRIAEALKIPELDMELDRAVWQVDKALRAEKEKSDLDSTSTKPEEKK
jgi:hypothetical protein